MTEQEKREKVIKGLERCVQEAMPCDNECPYLGHTDDECMCDIRLFRDALALLKSQEPVKPSWRRGIPFCGKCGRHFADGFKYCPDCGREVKWE